MPIYMDRHDVSELVTAEMVAHLHKEDLKVQDQFGCCAMTYWFDGARKMAFCLVDAPNEQALHEMHKHAHGEVPNSIIEVEPGLVEAFLGRIQDPENHQQEKMLIIDEPALRAIMMIDIEPMFSDTDSSNKRSWQDVVPDTVIKHGGSIVKQSAGVMLVSFKSLTLSVAAGIELFSNLPGSPAIDSLSIAITVGVPVNGQQTMFADCIRAAETICTLIPGKLVLSAEANSVLSPQNTKDGEQEPRLQAINEKEQSCLQLFMNQLEQSWHNPELTVGDFTKPTGMSKSQLYRVLMSATGKSPNQLISAFRLRKAAAILIRHPAKSVAEVAYQTGFTSPSYFSKSFRKRYQVLPSRFQSAN